MKVTDKIKTYILRFIGYSVIPGIGMLLGYWANLVVGSFFLTLISPMFRFSDRIFASKLFDSRMSVLEYVINVGILFVFVAFLLQTIIQARSLSHADLTVSKLPVKRFFLFGLWAGLSISQFLFRVILPIL